jgi:hypothetical protein
MADSDIQIPGLGHTKKSTLYAVGVGVILVFGVAYYRSKKSAAAQAASVASAGTNQTDPATGYPYGSPEDAAALATQANYYQSTGSGGGGSYGGSPSPSQGTGFVSNAAWAQAYEQYAVNNIQSDSNTVAAALGKYLTGQPLTPDQLNVVEQAIAFEGLPPISGTNGYPPSYQLQQSTPTGGGSGGTGQLPKVGTVIYGPWLVQPGQTEQSVASRFGIQPNAIIGSWQPGKTVIIPWLIKPGQTWSSIAAVYEIDPNHLMSYVGVS